jgi:isopentenyl-diphosphate Delta-isomerase
VLLGTSADTELELVVLLDAEGRRTGTADKATVHGPDTALHLGFSAYLFDAEGRVLVTRRALDKRTFPGVWTNSVCGHPAPGEPVPDAIRRRARRELGIEVGLLRLVLPAFSYRAQMLGLVENEQCPVYAGWLAPGSELAIARDEVAEVEWVRWGDFADSVHGGRTVSPWCAEQVPELVALGPHPDEWPEGAEGLLPEAARLA